MRHNWKKTSLGELQKQGLADVQTGPFGTVLKASEYSEEGVPVISVGEIREGFLQVTERTPLVSASITKRLPQFILADGDIVFGRKGAIDRNSIINEKQVGWFLGSDAIRLRLSQEINSVFISYQLRSKGIGKWLLQNSSGSIMPSLNQKVLDRLPLMVPEIPIQNKIASTLSSIDSKIELNNRINAELEAMAKTIYDYWFVQFDFPISAAYAASVGQPELEGRPYKSSGGEMVWNEKLKREVPKGWENCSLSEIGDIIGGSTPSKAKKEYFTSGGSGIPWITPKDLSGRKGKRFISHGEFDVTEAGRKSASLKIMPKGTVLLSSRAPVGYMAIAREPVTTNQGFKSLVPKDGFSTEYVFLTVHLYLPAIIKKASGSTFAEISSSTLKTVEIASPPQELIEKFTAIVAPMFAQQDVLEQENQELASLRDWLLPMLMNGQVKVGEVMKEYVQDGEVGMAAEGGEKYNSRK